MSRVCEGRGGIYLGFAQQGTGFDTFDTNLLVFREQKSRGRQIYKGGYASVNQQHEGQKGRFETRYLSAGCATEWSDYCRKLSP